MDEKYFIITSGATGSGKTKLITETLKHLSLDENSPVTKILIDDLVENDKKYKEKIKEIIVQIDKDCGNKCEGKDESYKTQCIIDCEKKKFTNNADDKLYKSFSNAYSGARYNYGCNKVKASNLSCEDINDKKLKDIKNEPKPKIVVFESTGQYIPKWLLTNIEYIPLDYTVVFAYSIVTIDNLIERNKFRAYKSIVEFKNNESKPAPRLPDVSKKTFTGIVNTIKSTLIHLYENCIKNNSEDIDKIKCGDRQINRLLIFDNNTPEFKNIYDFDHTKLDSIIPKDAFSTILDISFGKIMNGGKTKKYRKSTKNYIKRKNTYKTKKINKKYRK